jgi:endonuclease III
VTSNPDVRSRLAKLVGRLRTKYGPPAPPRAKTAFELVAWEKVAYLASDEKRASAFALLRRKIGLTPRKILAASRAELIDVLATGGIAAPERADNLIKAAELVDRRFRRLARRRVPAPASRSEETADAYLRNR